MFFDTLPPVIIAIASLLMIVFASAIIYVKRAWSPWTFWFIAYFAIAVVVTVYDINCLILGKCDIWAWIKSILILMAAAAATAAGATFMPATGKSQIIF